MLSLYLNDPKPPGWGEVICLLITLTLRRSFFPQHSTSGVFPGHVDPVAKPNSFLKSSSATSFCPLPPRSFPTLQPHLPALLSA